MNKYLKKWAGALLIVGIPLINTAFAQEWNAGFIQLSFN